MKMKVWSFLRSIGQKWKIDPKEFILWVVPFLLFSPGIFGGKVHFWGTILLQFIPWRHLALELIKGGEVPLWNPYSGMGAPLLANYQSALLYPPTWGLLVLEAVGGLSWSAIGQGIFIALHLGFCAVGMKRWLGTLGVRDLGQMVGGIAFGLSGYLVSRASFQSIIFSASWMPWILLSAQRSILSARNERRKNLFWLIVVITMNLLAGHAQTSWYILWATTAWVVWQSLIAPKSGWRDTWETVGKNIVRWGSAVGWTILVAAAQLIPTGEYLLNSQRSVGIDREIGLTYSFWPWRFLTMLMPNFFGNPAHGNYWGYANYWEDAVYSGSMAVLLSICAIGKVLQKTKSHSSIKLGRDSLRSTVFFWGLISVLAMILALGKNLPFYNWLLDNIPGFNLFQAPTRISLIAQFGLTVLTAIGIDLWEKPQGHTLYWTRLGTAGFFSMLIVAFVIYSQDQGFYPTILLSVTQFGLMGFIFGILLLLKSAENLSLPCIVSWKPRFQFLGWWKILIFAFFLGDLIWMGWGLNPVISIDVFRTSALKPGHLNANSPAQRFFMNSQDEYDLKFERYFRFDTFRNLDDWVSLRLSMLPNLNLLDRLAMVNNFDPFVPARFANWLDAMNKAHEKGDERNYQRLLRISGVGTLVEVDDERVRLTPIGGEDRFQFFPCANQVRTANEALNAVLTDANIGLNKIVLETNGELMKEACSMPQGDVSYSIKILSETANQIQLEMRTEQKGWLVVKDTFYPGWMVRVNGDEKTIFAANSVFRAVYVDEGTNIVEFRYQPFSFRLGAILSIFSLITLIIYRCLGKNNDR
ncbi:MAG: YfhO family protein [Anaerolineales bacterium]|nr:YfhO family protein [Anaerolineales bacterium]